MNVHNNKTDFAESRGYTTSQTGITLTHLLGPITVKKKKSENIHDERSEEMNI